VRILSLLKPARLCAVMRPTHMMVCVFLMVGISLMLRPIPTYAVQNETREEKATNLKNQAVGGLFQRWTFDRDQPNAFPNGFIKSVSADEPIANWVVRTHATAPSPPQVIAGSSSCARLCYQLLLADGLQYEYPDLSVRFHVPEGTAGLGGVVFGLRDTRNFYAAVVDPIAQKVQLVRLSDGQELPLADASVKLKPVDWHSFRLQRNTIISKDFIEVFIDGVLVLSVEDQALGAGQIGLVVLGTSTVLFDSFHAVPLFSHRPLSAPPAY